MPKPITVSKPRLSIYGAGRLGRTLGHLWHRRGAVQINQVYCLHSASARDAIAFIGAGRACTPDRPPEPCDVWLLACPDESIGDAARWLSTHFALSDRQTVFHCAGSLGHQVLAAAQPARLASVHPIHAFAQPQQSVAQFAGSHCVAEGDPSALAQLQSLFSALDARWLALETSAANAKARYHAATVSASNHLISLLDQAQRLAVSAGLTPAQARALLRPLATQNLDNVFQHAAPDVLTGPVSRGDGSTITAHLKALADEPTDQALYRALAQATLAIARQQGATSPERLDALAALLAQSLKSQRAHP